MDEPQKSGIGHRGLWIVPLFALFVLILVMLQQAPPPGLCVLGDVRERQAGRIPAALFDTAFNAGDFSHGIGSAAADGWEGLGESLLVGGEAFVRSTAHESPQYYRLQRAPRFRTSALTAVPAGTPARSQIILTPGSSMAEVLQRLAVRHPEGVLAAGFVQFELLRRYAISRPPIHGDSIPAKPARYYTEPLESDERIWTYVVALAMANVPTPDSLSARLLPLRIDGIPENFAIALALAEPPALTDETPNRGKLQNLGRVSGGSIVARGELLLYPAQPLGDCLTLPRQ